MLIPDETILRYRRSPLDVVRVGVWAATGALLLAGVRWADRTVDGVGADVGEAVAGLPGALQRLTSDMVSVLLGLLGILILVLVIRTRRGRVIGYLVLAQGVAGLMFLGARQLMDLPLASEAPARLAGATAGVMVLGPFLTTVWRRVGRGLVVTLALVDVVVSVSELMEIPLALTSGALAGSLVMLAFGRPMTRPPIGAVAAALDRALPGLPWRVADRIVPDGETLEGPRHFEAAQGDHRIFVKVHGEDDWADDAMSRLGRAVRYRRLGDEHAPTTVRRAVENEALCGLLAGRAGVRTPALRTMAAVDDHTLLLAWDLVDGDVPAADTLEDAQLSDLWAQVALLHDHRIAHRGLHRRNLLVDTRGRAWLTDFGRAEVAADDALLAADVAQLLSTTAILTDAKRTVTAAMAALGRDRLAAALPQLQSGTLRRMTRRALKDRPGLLDELQQATAEAVGIEEPEFLRIERFTPATLLTVGMVVAATYVLLPQLADLGGIIEEVRGANWVTALPLALASLLTYVGAAVSLAGSVPNPVRFRPNLAAQVAAGFAGALAPSSVGGMAVNVRFLQRQGVDSAVAVSGVGLNTVGGAVVHLGLTATFMLAAGRSSVDGLPIPSPGLIAVGVAAVALVGGVAFAVPQIRRIVLERAIPLLRRSIGGVAAAVQRPAKLVQLLGGSALITLSYIACLTVALAAFGVELGFIAIGTVYLLGSALASAAPTPGGLGALEAALISGLVSAGVPGTAAVPAVFLFRLGTYWLPMIPGWACFSVLRRNGDL